MAFVLLAVCAAHPALARQCAAQSGPHTTALVELYASDRCSSCPLAQQRLAALARAAPSLIFLVLHVDERAYAADARDPLARRRLTPRQRLALLHPPAILLQGREFAAWAGPDIAQAVLRVNAQPAAARIGLEIVLREPQALRVLARSELLRPDVKDAALYLAAFQTRGSERAVLAWQGPFPLAGGVVRQERRLALLPGASRGGSGVVGFVQQRRSGEVLQALVLGDC